MARPLRIQYPGAIYHVTCRGNERKEIFKDDKDRERFLEILFQSINIYSVKLFCYVMMKNHFHLLMETPLGNLGECMRHFNITYTGYYNRMHRRSGHLYQGRYKSILVERDTYLSVLSRYIHLNPVRTVKTKSMTEKERRDYLFAYRGSSLGGYIDGKRKERIIDYRMVLEEYGGHNDRGRRAYRKRIEGDIATGIEIRDKIIGQSVLGSANFIQWVKDTYLRDKTDRECPPMREIRRYGTGSEIESALKKVTGMTMEEIKRKRGSVRQIAMDVLYRRGGLTGVEIGKMLGVDYSTVSQGRKRLREKLKQDKGLRVLMERIEDQLSIGKN
ncbi:MAG: transposase [Thermodesulfovibrionales bacterium]|nr:transposase [Thermodesulfovibrionales bacterium]